MNKLSKIGFYRKCNLKREIAAFKFKVVITAPITLRNLSLRIGTVFSRKKSTQRFNSHQLGDTKINIVQRVKNRVQIRSQEPTVIDYPQFRYLKN